MVAGPGVAALWTPWAPRPRVLVGGSGAGMGDASFVWPVSWTLHRVRLVAVRTGRGLSSDSRDRYDAVADWYEQTFAGYLDGPSASALGRLLGAGSGWCLDVGCGGGLHFPTIMSTGRSTLGIDYLSFNQLRVASTRSRYLVQADAARLPFRDSTFAAVTSTFTHTDTEVFGALVVEVARVLAPGGRSSTSEPTPAS